jgi:hypothetical protein
MMVRRERRDRNPLSNKWRRNEWPASHPSYFSWYAMSKLVIIASLLVHCMFQPSGISSLEE